MTKKEAKKSRCCEAARLAAKTMAAIQQSGKSAAELAADYRLPEDYIAAVLQAEVPPEGEENEIEG